MGFLDKVAINRASSNEMEDKEDGDEEK